MSIVKIMRVFSDVGPNQPNWFTLCKINVGSYIVVITSTLSADSLCWEKVMMMMGERMASQTRWAEERMKAGTMQSSLPTDQRLLYRMSPGILSEIRGQAGASSEMS